MSACRVAGAMGCSSTHVRSEIQAPPPPHPSRLPQGMRTYLHLFFGFLIFIFLPAFRRTPRPCRISFPFNKGRACTLVIRFCVMFSFFFLLSFRVYSCSSRENSNGRARQTAKKVPKRFRMRAEWINESGRKEVDGGLGWRSRHQARGGGGEAAAKRRWFLTNTWSFCAFMNFARALPAVYQGWKFSGKTRWILKWCGKYLLTEYVWIRLQIKDFYQLMKRIEIIDISV